MRACVNGLVCWWRSLTSVDKMYMCLVFILIVFALLCLACSYLLWRLYV